MKLNVVMFYDKLLGAYCNPAFSDREPEIEAKSLDRFIRSKGQNYQQYLGKDFYFLGTFDDETGEFNLLAQKQLLLTTPTPDVKEETNNG